MHHTNSSQSKFFGESLSGDERGGEADLPAMLSGTILSEPVMNS